MSIICQTPEILTITNVPFTHKKGIIMAGMGVPEVNEYSTNAGLTTAGILNAMVNANAGFNLASGAIAAIQATPITISGGVTIDVPSSPVLSNLTGLRPIKPGELDPVFPAVPEEPTLITIDYGDIVDFPAMDLNPVSVPEEVINTAVERYASSLLTAIKAKLLDRITNGGTGLSPAIETAIWNRDEERALLALAEAKTRAAGEWSKLGWSLPNGILAESIGNLETEYLNKRLEVSKDISIKQADLEQTNVNTSLQLAAQVEQSMMAYHNQFCELMLRATESLQKAKNEIYSVWTAFYKTYVESIKNYSEAMSARTSAKLDANKSLLAKYGLTLEKLKTQVQMEVERISALLKAYSSDISAYGAESGALQAISNVYVELYRAQGSLAVGAAQVGVSANAANIQAAIASAQVQIQALIAKGHAAAQVAAGALAAAHTNISLSSANSAHVSRSGSESISHNLTGKSNLGS